MAEFALSGEAIFPTTNNIANGKKLNEVNISDALDALAGSNFVVSGFTVPATSANLTLAVAAGEAVIAGRRVYIATATTVACADDDTSYIYLRLDVDGLGNVTGATLEINTTGSAPALSTSIAEVVAESGAITETTDKRVLHPSYSDSEAYFYRDVSVGGGVSTGGNISAGGDVSAGGSVTASSDVSAGGSVNATTSVNGAEGNFTDLNVTNPIPGTLNIASTGLPLVLADTAAHKYLTSGLSYPSAALVQPAYDPYGNPPGYPPDSLTGVTQRAVFIPVGVRRISVSVNILWSIVAYENDTWEAGADVTLYGTERLSHSGYGSSGGSSSGSRIISTEWVDVPESDWGSTKMLTVMPFIASSFSGGTRVVDNSCHSNVETIGVEYLVISA